MQPRRLLSSLLQEYLWSTRTPRFISADLVSKQLPISCCLVSFFPKHRFLHFQLLTSWLISPDCWALFVELHNHLACQSLLPTFSPVISKLPESTLPIIQILNEKVERYWLHYALLWFSSSDWPPAGLPTTDCMCYFLLLPETLHYFFI